MSLRTETDAPIRPLGVDLSKVPGRDRPASSLLDVVRLRPGWPLVLLFVGYPIWWVLGIADVVPFVAAGAMVWELLRVRTIRVPRHFGWWLLFLLWVVLGVALVRIDAPGAVAASSATRYLTWAWRLLWYLKATVLLLYIGNQRSRLSLAWVCRVFSWMFVFIVAGGLLGVLAPGFELHSLAESVLPRGLTSSSFVFSKVHPVASEAVGLLAGGGGRTSAPFAYSNVWGLNFACFLPFFVIAWFGREAGWRRYAAPFVLVIAIVPVVLSLNRGLWVALISATIFVAVRSALAGKLRLLGVLVAGLALIGALIAFSPLGHAIGDRLHGSGPTSNVGRTNLSTLSFTSMARTSPILGFGTTRDVQGTFDSIAGGSTTSCPRCSLPSLGTQGQLWLVTFAQGIGGAILYFGFLILTFLRHFRVRSGYAVAGLAVLIMHFITSIVYGADNLSILAILGAVAILWRARVEENKPSQLRAGYEHDEPTLQDYAGKILQHRRFIAVLAIFGILGGVLVTHLEGTTYAATVSVFVPYEPIDPTQNEIPATLDTIAQYATSGTALDAMRRASGPGHNIDASKVSVTATPNSGILHISYVARSAETARRVVAAAARTVLVMHRATLENDQQKQIAVLQGELDSLGAAVRTIAGAAAPPAASHAATPLALWLRTRIRDVSVQLAQATQLPLNAGSVTSSVTARAVRDRSAINITTGLALALLVGVGLALTDRPLTPRLRTKKFTTASGDMRVLARGPSGSIDVDALLALENPAACVGIGTQRHALATAVEFDSRINRAGRRRRPSRVILVGAGEDRLRTAVRARRCLEKSGVHVAGVVIVDRSPGQRRRNPQ